jgi:hypothetical protein
LQEHSLLSYLDEKAYLLMAIDEGKALNLLSEHLDTLPPGMHTNVHLNESLAWILGVRDAVASNLKSRGSRVLIAVGLCWQHQDPCSAAPAMMLLGSCCAYVS